jgi:hypothetical protein
MLMLYERWISYVREPLGFMNKYNTVNKIICTEKAKENIKELANFLIMLETNNVSEDFKYFILLLIAI